MSYDAEELRSDIVELFDDAVGLSPYCEDFGVLRMAQALRIRELTDEELLEEARRARPLPKIHPFARERAPRTPKIEAQRKRRVGRGTGTDEHQRHIIEALARIGLCVCLVCGARAPAHRCPG